MPRYANVTLWIGGEAGFGLDLSPTPETCARGESFRRLRHRAAEIPLRQLLIPLLEIGKPAHGNCDRHDGGSDDPKTIYILSQGNATDIHSHQPGSTSA